MGDLCSFAKHASKSAHKSGEPEAHASAAIAHEKAAKFCLAEGDPEKAKKHSEAAAEHHALAKSSESDSSSNPLLAWTKVKADG
jgi:hypothetical protein